jgi:hypothetical protein
VQTECGENKLQMQKNKDLIEGLMVRFLHYKISKCNYQIQSTLKIVKILSPTEDVNDSTDENSNTVVLFDLKLCSSFIYVLLLTCEYTEWNLKKNRLEVCL